MDLIPVLILASFFAYQTESQAETQASAIARFRSGVVSVTTYDRDNKPLTRGIGFIASEEGNVLTRSSLRPPGASRIEVRTADGKTYRFKRIVSENREADFLVVGVDLPKGKVKPVAINSAVPAINEQVTVINIIGAAQLAAVEGSVLAVQDSPAGKTIKIAAKGSPVLSGCPVINSKGEVVGITRAQSEGENSISADSMEVAIRLLCQDSPPKLLNNPQPSYTTRARNNGVEGVVRVRVLIGSDGLVKKVNLLSGLPDGLDEQAIKAAFKLKFKPAMRSCMPVAFWKPVEVEFRLRSQP